MACLDTSCLLDMSGKSGREVQRRPHAKVCAFGRAEGLTVTRFSLAELLVGVYKSRHPQVEEERIRELMSDLEFIEFRERAARQYGRITAHLHRIGRPIGDMDALIAASALSVGERLITRNVSHFENVPGLVVETY